MIWCNSEQANIFENLIMCTVSGCYNPLHQPKCYGQMECCCASCLEYKRYWIILVAEYTNSLQAIEQTSIELLK